LGVGVRGIEGSPGLDGRSDHRIVADGRASPESTGGLTEVWNLLEDELEHDVAVEGD
jgi:hypothetical protein